MAQTSCKPVIQAQAGMLATSGLLDGHTAKKGAMRGSAWVLASLIGPLDSLGAGVAKQAWSVVAIQPATLLASHTSCPLPLGLGARMLA